MALFNERAVSKKGSLIIEKRHNSYCIIEDGNVVMSQPVPSQGKHKVAKEQLAAEYLKQNPIAAAEPSEPVYRTATEGLNLALIQSGFTNASAHFQQRDSSFVCEFTTTMKTDGSEYKASGSAKGSKALAKDSAALALLEQMAHYHPNIVVFHTLLRQTSFGSKYVFPLGGRTALVENHTMEFKGTGTNGGLNNVQYHFTKSKKGNRVVGEYICSFLNGSGGSILIGIEDNGDIYGVNLPAYDRDVFKDRLDKALQCILPPCNELVMVRYHPVTPPQKASSKVTRELAALSIEAQRYIADLKARAKITPATEAPTVVLEVRVQQPTTCAVYGYNDVAYIRMDAVTRTMTVQELRQAFAAELAARSK
jgi:hypothetical protein